MESGFSRRGMVFYLFDSVAEFFRSLFRAWAFSFPLQSGKKQTLSATKRRKA
jgi:hypothetical protein